MALWLCDPVTQQPSDSMTQSLTGTLHDLVMLCPVTTWLNNLIAWFLCRLFKLHISLINWILSKLHYICTHPSNFVSCRKLMAEINPKRWSRRSLPRTILSLLILSARECLVSTDFWLRYISIKWLIVSCVYGCMLFMYTQSSKNFDMHIAMF